LTAIQLPELALTLWQPWCWLCAHGYKPLENRPPTFTQKKFRGDFWLHSGLKISREVYDQAKELTDKVTAGINHIRLPAFSELSPSYLSALPLGYIIGRATIVDALPVLDRTWTITDGWRMEGKFAFVLENAVYLRRPVKVRGYQGFWRVPGPVLEQLREAA
jgi:hypothetical protein